VQLDAGGSSSVGPVFLPLWYHIVGGVPVSVTPGLVLTATEPGLYMFSNLNIQNGCSASDTVLVDWSPAVEADATAEDITCYGRNDGTIRVQYLTGGLAPLEYSIDNQIFTSNPVFQGLGPGTYPVTVRDVLGCQWQSEVTLTEPSPIAVTLTASDTLIDLGQYVLLKAKLIPPGLVVGEIRWQPALPDFTPDALTQKIKPEETTQYEVQVTDVRGCTATARVTVEVVSYDVYAPNAIAPDAPANGVFTLYTGPGIERVKLLRVYDRWGSLVFENRDFAPNDPAAGWDGRLKSQAFSPGVFVWYAELEGKDGRVLQFSGDVTVVR
jgi:hypothetical protein